VDLAGDSQIREAGCENSSLDAENLRRKVFWMNEAFEDDSGWPWYWHLLIILLLGGFLLAISIPNFIGGGPSKIDYVINNLRQIDGAKNEWAFEHGFTNESQISQLTNLPTENDLFPFIKRPTDQSNNLVQSYCGEIYMANPMNKPPEAKLARKMPYGTEKLPIGTIIRLPTNTNFWLEILLPDGTRIRH
jgi:hypothetical protein